MTTAQVAQDNAALVARGYEAFAAGDMTILKGLYHPDAAFYTVADKQSDGSHLGRDAIFLFFEKIFNESKGTFKAQPMTIAATDDRVFVFQDLSGTRNGYALHDNTVMVFTIDRGLVREMREFITPASHLQDFWDA
jgi:uncharacterized protein